MTEWEMVLALVVLIGLIATIVKPMISLTRSITALTNTMESLKTDLNGLTTKNTESHRRIWKHNEEQDERINDHETRITIIEKGKGQNHEN